MTASAAKPGTPRPRSFRVYRDELQRLVESRKASGRKLNPDEDKYLLMVAEQAAAEELAEFAVETPWAAQRYREQESRQYVQGVLARAAGEQAELDRLRRERLRLSVAIGRRVRGF